MLCRALRHISQLVCFAQFCFSLLEFQNRFLLRCTNDTHRIENNSFWIVCNLHSEHRTQQYVPGSVHSKLHRNILLDEEPTRRRLRSNSMEMRFDFSLNIYSFYQSPSPIIIIAFSINPSEWNWLGMTTRSSWAVQCRAASVCHACNCRQL